MNKIFSLLSIIAFFIFVIPVHAMTARGGEAVTVPKSEIITGTLLAGGNSVVIDGVVHGDVLCAAQSVTVSGTVDGDVLCAAQSIRITGTVGESVRAVAQTVDIAGPVKRNVMVAGQTISVNTPGTIGGEILAAGQTAFIDAKVGGDINLAVAALTFGDNARVAGSVKYESRSVATLAPSATIAGTLTQSLPKQISKRSPVPQMKKIPTGPTNILVKIIIYMVLAVIITAVAPKRTKKILDAMRTAPMAAAVAGFVTLIVVPVIIMVIAITIVGIPLAIILGILYGLTLAACRVFAAILVGEYLFASFHANQANNMLLTILLGVTVTWVVFSVPVIGGIASFLSVIWALGAIIQTRKA